ncbi:MAG TPA: hypothetical protein DIW43_00385 [Spongiibacteraceae bacterium]|nr:hypothetical protein [Spongiibacteraceae bacterium]HCS25876.1 hypothetical protein [Spongiibacteraceae bacterium]|tara:strand:+ start:76 stop:771 length:696 start_codon:yes stop_codon:yes gene_type:complete
MAPREAATPSAKVVRFPDRKKNREQHRITRIVPEHDGLCILYSHHALSREKLFAGKILCWGIQENGEVVALLPWLSSVTRCTDLKDPASGRWEGYYNPATGAIFETAPAPKIAELEAAHRYYHQSDSQKGANATPVQEIADNIGSHAACIIGQHLALHEVQSWQLLGNGEFQAMLADPQKQTSTPILPGDSCLYAAQSQAGFRYFFQYHIANQIKAGDPIAVRAVERLLEH